MKILLKKNSENGKVPAILKGREGLCMKGGVYTKEKCPVCGERFIRAGDDYICSVHQTRPRRFYIQLYSKELHKHINLFSDSRGNSFSAYEQAERILTKIRSEIDAGTFDPSRYVPQKLKPLKFLNWSQRWYEDRKIEARKGLISPSYLKTLRVYLYAFQNLFQDIDIRDIGTKKVREFYLSLNGSPKYIFNTMSCLHKMLQDALDNEEIGKIPKFPKIEIPEPDIKIIDLDIQDQIIARIPDQMDRTYILTTARLMLRPSETRALCWEDWDFKHDRVTIRRHFSLNQLMPTTKSKRIRIVPIDNETREAVSHLPRHISSPFVFQKNGKPYSEAYARKLWKRIAKEMGVDTPLYQGTRHSSATEARERVGIDKVQEFMGHTSSATTKRYAKVNVNGLRSVLRKK